MQPTGAASSTQVFSTSHPFARNRALREQAATRGATGTEIAVLLALADFRNEHGTCWPSLPTLVRQSGFADKTVRRALARLRDLGLLHVVIPATPRTSTRYRVEEAGHSDQADRSERPVKFPVKTQEEIKTGAPTHTRVAPAQEPDRGVGTRTHDRAPTPGSGSVLPTIAQPTRGNAGVGGTAPERPSRSERSPRAERSAANKAAWATRPRVALAPPARVQPKPYQAPQPTGPLVRDMDPSARAELFRTVYETLRPSC